MLDPALRNLATPINDQIQGNFSTTITAFAGRGGKIAIPAAAVPALSNLLSDLGKALGIKAGSTTGSAMVGVKAQTGQPDAATIAPASDAELANSDAQLSEQNAQVALAATSDTDLDKLADGENDLSGIPLVVLAVLRKYNVI